ncbi:MAG: hypothetical protein KDE27_01490, partial [Planctomycetes bacterium]|nr:hypothetical protein [Planctomycetota bacterium]
PAGQVLQARWSPESAAAFEVAGTRRTQRVPLREFEVEPVGMRPVLIGGPGASEWRDDKNWQWTHLSPDRPARWFPELPGTYRIALRVESLPSPEFAPWPTFAPAVNVATAIVMTGEVGDWGEPHDGLRARLVWSTGASSIDRTPIALQLENHAGEAKRYNYAGSTIARIPQPQHFTLLVDGVEWTQNERVPVVLRAVDSLAPHPVGQRRTIVTRPGFWSADGQTLGASAGRHRIALVFHFRPSVWDTRDTSIWHGEIRTGELEVNVPD